MSDESPACVAGAGSRAAAVGNRAARALLWAGRGRAGQHSQQKSVPVYKSWELGKGKPAGPAPELQKSLPSCLNSKE